MSGAVEAVDRVDDAAARELVDRTLTVPRWRQRRVCLGLAAVLVAACAARVLLGDVHISPLQFVRVLQGEQIHTISLIVTEITLPRTVLGVVTGVAFGVAGVAFQTVLRNPLASPDIIGVTMGASASAVFGIVVLGLRDAPLSLCSVAGALVIAVVTRWAAGPAAGTRMMLVGIALAVALASLIQYMFTRADVWDVQVVLRWLTGSLAAADWVTIGWAAPIVAVSVLAVAWCAQDLAVGELGQDAAVGLGMAPRRPDLVLAVAVLLTAVAVSAVGPMAFVAFASGPLARGLSRGRRSLTAAGLCGASIVVSADYIGDYLLVDINFPAGVVTGAAGAVSLLWLMSRGRNGRRSA